VPGYDRGPIRFGERSSFFLLEKRADVWIVWVFSPSVFKNTA